MARLTGTWLKKNDHTILDAATYDYNAAHQRTAFVDAAGTSVGYTYDPIGQLQIADSSDNGEDRGYTYDPAWNLNYRTNAGTLQNFYVDGENQLTNSTPGGYSTFDGNGNTLSMLSTPRYFGYDDENQLIAITNNPEGLQPKRTTLTYDGKLRLRVRREYNWDSTGGGEESLTLGGLAEPNGVGDGGFWTLASETRYIYDGNRVIQERDENNTPTVSYTRGPDLSGNLEGAGGIGGLLARSHGYSSGNWSTHNFYHADGNGNITYLVDASQSLAASYRYDPFGNTTASSGSLASANSYRFSSKQIHTESGLSYYLYRWYDPSLQRWLNRDPIGEEGGLNLYVGADNDLINGFDAVGLSPTLNPQNQIYAAECLETAANVGAQKLAQEQVKRQIIKKLAEQAAKEWEKKLKTKAGDLVKGRLKRVDDYPSQLEGKTYGELLKDKSPEARLMRKLIEESERLVEKTSGKPR